MRHFDSSSDWVLDRHPTSLVSHPSTNDAIRIASLEKRLRELRERYNTEMDQWKEYAERVTTWQHHMLRVVRYLKAETKQDL